MNGEFFSTKLYPDFFYAAKFELGAWGQLSLTALMFNGEKMAAVKKYDLARTRMTKDQIADHIKEQLVANSADSVLIIGEAYKYEADTQKGAQAIIDSLSADPALTAKALNPKEVVRFEFQSKDEDGSCWVAEAEMTRDEGKHPTIPDDPPSMIKKPMLPNTGRFSNLFKEKI